MNNNSIMVIKAERILFYSITILICVFLGSSYFLAMTDLPQHAGQVEALRSIITGNTGEPWFNDIKINHFTVYWVGYLSTLVLSFFMPINYAINIIVGIAFLLFVLSFSLLRKKFGGPNVLDWVLLPSFFGFSYAWGFLTFMLAIPIGVLLVIQNIKLLEKGNTRYFINLILLGILLYFSHILVFLYFCLISSCMTLVNKGSTIKNKIKQLGPFFILSLLIPVFLLLNSDFLTENGLGKYFSASLNYNYGSFGGRIAYLLLFPWSIDRYPYIPLEGISIILIGLPFCMGFKLCLDPKRYVPFVVFLIMWFVFPEQVAKTSLVYPRFSILFFPFYVLVFEKNLAKVDIKEAQGRLVCVFLWIGTLLFLLMLSVVNQIKFDKEVKDFKSILLQVPEKKRALSLVYDAYHRSNRDGAVYVYFPLWYQALKHGWVDFNFAWFPPQVVRYKVEAIPEDRHGFAWSPEQFVYFKNCDKYDLIFVRASSKEQLEKHENLMNKSTCSHELFYQSNSWFLYSL